MVRETLVAHPCTWGACAIGSDLFTATIPALVLLVPGYRGAYPLPIKVNFHVVWSNLNPINRCVALQFCRHLLHRNPAVPDELPCQMPAEYNQCWAASNRTFCKSKVPKSQERIYLGDFQKQTRTLKPPIAGWSKSPQPMANNGKGCSDSQRRDDNGSASQRGRRT